MPTLPDQVRTAADLGKGVALMLALYLLIGIALTGSRTAWIAVAMLIAVTWFWRGIWRHSGVPWLVTGLGVYFWVCVYLKGWLRGILLLGDVEDVTRIASETRPQVWAMFLDAVWQHPIVGYGWNQIALAHLAVAADHPPLYVLFSHTHNLLLDLILWCGIPCGLLLCGALLWWLWRNFRAVAQAEDAVLLLVVLVVANHALLEYPLSYAYFLLPLGLVMGALDVRLLAPVWQIGGRWVVTIVWALATLLLSLMVRDYWRVETSYFALRFELIDKAHGTPWIVLRDVIANLFEISRSQGRDQQMHQRLFASTCLAYLVCNLSKTASAF